MSPAPTIFSSARFGRRLSPWVYVPVLAAVMVGLGLYVWVSHAEYNPTESAPQPVERTLPPPLDRSRATVALDRIVFDTFSPGPNRAVPLPEASDELIAQLYDAIEPVDDPQYVEAERADWLRDRHRVVGYVGSDGQAYAYPVRILARREIVNETIGGEPIVVTYCPLCDSGIVYSRRLGGRTLTFGNTSALIESDMVMVDRETGSYWWQVRGEAIVGTLAGERLKTLPSATLPWGRWRELHPDTLVLELPGVRLGQYPPRMMEGYPERIDAGQFAFPVGEAGRDDRLPASAPVLSIERNGERRAYPLAGEAPRIIHDRLGGEDVVVFMRDGTGRAFDPKLDGETRRFRAGGNGFIDEATGSVWDFSGRAAEGPLAGSRLRPLPSKFTYWFAIAAAEPGISLYEPSAPANR